LSRRALVAAMMLGAALAAPATVAAQDVPVPAPGPTLQVVGADLVQRGGDLKFGLHFNRTFPLDELDPAHGRTLCIVLSPQLASRRRICIGRRAERLSASLADIDESGAVAGPTRLLRGVHVGTQGDFMRVTASARSLRVRLGTPVSWRVVVGWRDGGPCDGQPDPLACVQVVPPTGELRLRTKAPPAPPRPAFARRGRLRLLATGDSMIQIIDGYLKQRLESHRATTVRSDAHISTGISKLKMLDWITKARGQAVSYKPDVTVVFLGANDGFPMKTPSGANAPCCDAAWIGEYARRVASMMRSYSRGGRSLVYWLTLPAPRGGNFARVFNAVNPAIRRAAKRVGGGVRVIELGPTFTPGNRFRQTVFFHGKLVNARQADGVHLSTAGASIAASLIIARLRADHALPRAK
jgi:lysophospholipase L1-like esterase